MVVGPQVVWVVLHQAARDRRTERDRVAYETNSVRTQLEGPKRVHTSLDRTLRLAGTWNAR